MLTFLTSRLGLGLVAVVVLLGIYSAQELRLRHANVVAAQAAHLADALKDQLVKSEGARRDEHQAATDDATRAEQACDARVAAAHVFAPRIHALTEKPVATDPQTHCPVPGINSARELCDATGADCEP